MTAGASLAPERLGPWTGATVGTKFDDISIMVQRDYVRRELGERLHHIFLVRDGGDLIPCRGPGFCRECNKGEMMIISLPCSAGGRA